MQGFDFFPPGGQSSTALRVRISRVFEIGMDPEWPGLHPTTIIETGGALPEAGLG